MPLHPKVQEDLLARGYSRRSIARIALGAAAEREVKLLQLNRVAYYSLVTTS
jgi:hypothetical protein